MTMHSNAHIEPHPFSVRFVSKDDRTLACDWRWPNRSEAIWTMSVHEGVEWIPDGTLTEEGRMVLIERFGVQEEAKRLTLEVISKASPVELMKDHDNIGKHQHIKVISDTMGDHISARSAA